MSKYRQAARIDDNQPDIVKALLDIPGVTVETGHDDILVGYKGFNYWIEIKNPNTIKKSGGFKSGAIKKSQYKIKDKWKGQYLIAWTLEQILSEIGVTR